MSINQIIKEALKVEGWFRDDQMRLLYPFVKNLDIDGLLVEIGTYHGRSTRFFSSANPKIKILTIDLIDFIEVPEYTGCIIDRAVLKKGNIFQVIGDSSKLAKSFNWQIDFLFIDGCHLYKYIQKDINSWTPYIVLNGYVAFHDYRHSHSGVVKVVNNWIKNNKKFVEVSHNVNIFIAKRVK